MSLICFIFIIIANKKSSEFKLYITTFEFTHKFSKDLENIFNKLGYVPVVSSVSGGLREVFGATQVITGLAMTSINSLRKAYAKEETSIGQLQKKVDLSKEQVRHGIANMMRAVLEIIPFINFSCLCYDLAKVRIEYSLIKNKDAMSFSKTYMMHPLPQRP